MTRFVHTCCLLASEGVFACFASMAPVYCFIVSITCCLTIVQEEKRNGCIETVAPSAIVDTHPFHDCKQVLSPNLERLSVPMAVFSVAAFPNDCLTLVFSGYLFRFRATKYLE